VAVLFAVLTHLFLPDPQIEKNVKVVQEQKETQKKQQDGNDEHFDLP
jgi:hypothetical protein